jgi:hypothetical protein
MASQKPQTGSEHAARKDLTILKVGGRRMEQDRGAFKVKMSVKWPAGALLPRLLDY